MELGTTKDHEEVESTWSSDDDSKAFVLNGTVLLKDVGETNVNAQYSGESASCAITITGNTNNTRFKVLDTTIASIGYRLEFLSNGEVVPFNTLTLHQTTTGVVSVDSRTGDVTPIKNGDDIITVIYNGKKYGHHVKVEGIPMSLGLEEKAKTRTRKKKIEN